MKTQSRLQFGWKLDHSIDENPTTLSMKTQLQYQQKPTVLCPNLCVLGLPALALWLLQDRIQTVRHQVERNMPGIAWLLC